MTEQDRLAERFEQQRPHLRAVAYRMLGSLAEADDAVQEAWLRMSRADTGQVDDLRAWLTTVVARICLNALRSRAARREEVLYSDVPDPVITPAATDPEQEMLIADSVSLALLIVLESLTPAERLAFVLHDVFDVSFEEIALIVDRSEPAARQLASRARRQVRDADVTQTDTAAQWRTVDAFLAAARDGDFEKLLTLLDPDVLRRLDAGAGGPDVPRILRGAREVASGAIAFAQLGHHTERVLVNGSPGTVTLVDDKPYAVLGFSLAQGKIIEIKVLADPVRLSGIDLSALNAAT